MKRLATSTAAPPGLSNNKEDQARLGFESGRSAFQVNYPFIYPSAAEVEDGLPEERSAGRASRASSGRAEPRAARRHQPRRRRVLEEPGPRLRGGRSASRSPRTRSSPPRRAGCRRPREALYDDPKVKKAYPFADLLRESIEDGAPRPVTPGLQRHLAGDPEDASTRPTSIEPERRSRTSCKDRLEKAAEGKIF